MTRFVLVSSFSSSDLRPRRIARRPRGSPAVIARVAGRDAPAAPKRREGGWLRRLRAAAVPVTRRCNGILSTNRLKSLQTGLHRPPPLELNRHRANPKCWKIIWRQREKSFSASNGAPRSRSGRGWRSRVRVVGRKQTSAERPNEVNCEPRTTFCRSFADETFATDNRPFPL